MKKLREFWTEQKLDALRELYPTHSISQLSEKLGISVGSIHNKIKSLNELSKEEYGIVFFAPKKSNSKELNLRVLKRWVSESGLTQNDASKAA